MLNINKSRRLIVLLVLLALGIVYAYYVTQKTVPKRVVLPPEQAYINSFASFSAKRQYLKILNSAELVPLKQGDFLLTIWLRVNKKSTAARAYHLLQKFEDQTGIRQGFSLLLERERGGGSVMRPLVAWYDSKNSKQELFRYLDIKMPPKTWTLLALGVKEGRYVLMRAVNVQNGQALEIQNLGAYDLEKFSDISNIHDYAVGALGSGGLSGDLGPIMLIRGAALVDNLDEIIGTIVSAPEKIPNLNKDFAAKLELAVFPKKFKSDDLVVEYERLGIQP